MTKGEGGIASLAGKRRIELTLRENFCFFRSEPQVRGTFCFSGRERRGTDWKGVPTRARAKERADWAKATRRP